MSDKVVIVGGARTPMCEYVGTPGFGKFKDVSAIDLGAHASKAALARSKVDPASVEHVVMGNALQTSIDALYGARHVGLKAGIPKETPALTVNRLCGSGIQSIVNGAQLIQLGEAKTVLAGGMENMSQAPFALYGARSGIPFGVQPQLQDTLFGALLDPLPGLMMAQTAEKIAKRLGIGREAQDEYALRSHKLGTAAVKEGRFAAEIEPVVVKTRKGEETIATDDHIKPDTSMEALSKLRAAFGKDGTVTAGNASGVVDGAAAVVLTTADRAKADKLDVWARIVAWSYVGVEPSEMGIGPVPAIRKCVDRAGIALRDVDRIEINEAFSAQYLGCEKELELDRDKVNVNGGAIALGHPLGATGTRLVLTLMHELRRAKLRYGIASACIGGGQGIAILIENPWRVNPLIHNEGGRQIVRLTPGKRVLFLTKDLDLVERQLRGEANLEMKDVDPKSLLDDINTDVMTPAWVCFRHRPEDLALDAYAGLVHQDGRRVFPTRGLMDGSFEAIVSGLRKGTGSSRETAPQAEKWSGVHLVIAASFAPIHERNNVNLGQLMGTYEQLARLQRGESIPLEEFTGRYDLVTRAILESGGLFDFAKRYAAGEIVVPSPTTSKRPMTMGEKILAVHLLNDGRGEEYVKPGDLCLVRVDGGYSHEFTTAQVDDFLRREYGPDYRVAAPEKFAVFEDHLLYTDGVKKMAVFSAQIQTLRDLQNKFQKHTGVRDYSARKGVSPGICHQVAREQFVDPGDFIQATDSHTCMGGGNNALAWGVGATEYAALIHAGFTFVQVPESIRFELTGKLPASCTAKDLMLEILRTFAKEEQTLDRVMEFGGTGLASLSMDERATLTNMATECSAKSGICEADEVTLRWLADRRPGLTKEAIRARFVRPDPGAEYAGGVHKIDLSKLTPMVAEPGDPTYGRKIDELGAVKIDIAYAGSCTAGKEHDLDFYARVLDEAVRAGRKVAPGVRMVLQYGSESVRDYARAKGYLQVFEKAGVEVIDPGCGACIGCGPGVSETKDEVTISAINRNYAGRSGPGRLFLASPLSVAASAVEGRIVAYVPGMFRVGAGASR